MKNAITTLRTALQHALDELNRINSTYSCVRPDVTYGVTAALAATYLAPIKNASEIECRIVGKVVNDLLAAGYTVGVNDGEDDVVKPTNTDASVIFAALASTDMDCLLVRKPGSSMKSFVALVWGNGVDVISDYGTSLETTLADANALAAELGA